MWSAITFCSDLLHWNTQIWTQTSNVVNENKVSLGFPATFLSCWIYFCCLCFPSQTKHFFLTRIRDKWETMTVTSCFLAAIVLPVGTQVNNVPLVSPVWSCVFCLWSSVVINLSSYSRGVAPDSSACCHALFSLPVIFFSPLEHNASQWRLKLSSVISLWIASHPLCAC